MRCTHLSIGFDASFERAANEDGFLFLFIFISLIYRSVCSEPAVERPRRECVSPACRVRAFSLLYWRSKHDFVLCSPKPEESNGSQRLKV